MVVPPLRMGVVVVVVVVVVQLLLAVVVVMPLGIPPAHQHWKSRTLVQLSRRRPWIPLLLLLLLRNHHHHPAAAAATTSRSKNDDPNSTVCPAHSCSSSSISDQQQHTTAASTTTTTTAASTTTTTATISSSRRTLEEELHRAEQFRAFVRHMFAQLDEFYQTHQGIATRIDLQYHALEQWLQYFDMDPNLIYQVPLQQNWLETLYTKTKALAPTCLFTVWQWDNNQNNNNNNIDSSYIVATSDGGPTDDEMQILLHLDPSPLRRLTPSANNNHNNPNDGDYYYDPTTGELVIHNRTRLLQHMLQPFRHRGSVARVLDTIGRNIWQSLEYIAYAIPSTANLEWLARYAPLVEVGAGSGYWTAALQQLAGVDVIAYDAVPPQPPPRLNNPSSRSSRRATFFFDRNYTTIHQGTCLDIFASTNNNSDDSANRRMPNRTLLLIWPNNPDNVDNAVEFHSPALPPVWDRACVEAYVAAGGSTVILVAERQVHIRTTITATTIPDDWGLSATRQLQNYLVENFDLLEQQAIPTWYYRDDLTVWRLRSKQQQQSQQ